MVGKKRIAVVTLLAIMLITAMSVVSGCVNHLEDEVIIGDFVCQVMSDNTVHLKNLSEEGKKKKYIVVPQELDGMKVDMLGYRDAIFSRGKSHWESENLEKVFINSEYIFFLNGLFVDCPNIKKVIIINNDNEELEGYGSQAHVFSSLNNYLKRTPYQNDLLWNYSHIYVANVSYYYNYEEAPNDGYYWIDDVEDMELIDFIPEDPNREGFKFEGWFKEEECINEWDFETDKVEKSEEGKFLEFKENKLFAKWAKV